MAPRFLDVDPRTLHLPPSQPVVDLVKLHRQISRYGSSVSGMPVIWVSEGADGHLMINDGVTRATRVARLLPGTRVRVEVIDVLTYPVGNLPTIR